MVSGCSGQEGSAVHVFYPITVSIGYVSNLFKLSFLFSMCLLQSKANLLLMIYHSYSSCLLCSFLFVYKVM
jgi:hypothetical protein